MAYPRDIGVIDLMIGFPMQDKKAVYEYLMQGIRDRETKESFTFPAEYMFKDVPEGAEEGEDPIDVAFGEMDRFNVTAGLFGLSDQAIAAKRRDPKRVHLSLESDPNDVMGAVRKVRKTKDLHDIAAVTVFPAGCLPQVPVDDPKMYAIYATCIELDIPVIVNAGVAGPRFPSSCQHVERFDQVC
ncbi:MAG: amidohydrolase family protein, partial [Acidimicrobiia bacterium]